MAETVASSAGVIERVADGQLSFSDDEQFQSVASRLVKQLAELQGTACRIIRKIADGISGMSCKRLKSIEKSFVPIRVLLQDAKAGFGEKRVEKTAKIRETCKKELREEIERFSQKLRSSPVEPV